MSQEKNNENNENNLPSQLLIQFNRVESSKPAAFYGSDITCNSYIVLKVVRSVPLRENSNDRFMEREIILKARISPNQFAELLTTMNIGNGVPATLEMFNTAGLASGKMPEFEANNKIDTFHAEIAEKTKIIEDQLEELITVIDKTAMPAKSKQAIDEKVQAISRTISQNLPYILRQAGEQLDKAVSAAKGVVDSFYVGVCTKLGIKAIQNNMVHLITEKKDDIET